MRTRIISMLSAVSVIAIGCTTAPESKTCMCEVVTAQPTCPAPVASTEVAAAATSTQLASVPSPSPAPGEEIQEMNAPPVLVAQSQPATDAVKELPEESIIEEQDMEAASNSSQTLIVNSSGLNVRSGPSMESSVVGSLKRGTEVRMLSREGIWVMIGDNQYASIRYLSEKK